MSDSATGLLAIVIASAHTALFAVSWAWAARSRRVWFLVLITPVTVAWSLAGFPLVRALTYGTHPLTSPEGGLQTAGFAAVLIGFVGFFTCAVGALVTVLVKGVRGGRSA